MKRMTTAAKRSLICVISFCMIGLLLINFRCFLIGKPCHPTIKKPITFPSGGSKHSFMLKYQSLAEALEARHKTDPRTGAKIVIIAYVDSPYIKMALNLWESSFLQLDLDNHLFICADGDTCASLAEHGVACFKAPRQYVSHKASRKGTNDFMRKTHLKTEMTLEALQLGYTTLMIDIDMVFLKDPLPYFRCDDCDIISQDNGTGGINSGFVLARPTRASVSLHEQALKLGWPDKLSNQDALNIILTKMAPQHLIKHGVLSKSQFPRGKEYFELGGRMFATDLPCSECVVIHNNWIWTIESKIYRLKEFLWWMLDEEGYYSDANAKYITYDNPIDFGDESTEVEVKALRTAFRIGYILNRTVILPTFHCYGCKIIGCRHANHYCSLNTHISITHLDMYLAKRYREHMFLTHPKVPETVLNSQSPRIFINTVHSDTLNLKPSMFDLSGSNLEFLPQDPKKGATSDEIISWMKPLQRYSVLNFHSLYGVFEHFSPADKAVTFETKLKLGFVASSYRQIHTKSL